LNLKKVIKEKDKAINNLKKEFSEKEGRDIAEYNDIINNQKETIIEQANTIKTQKEIFDEFFESSEVREFWNEYINKIREKKKDNEI